MLTPPLPSSFFFGVVAKTNLPGISFEKVDPSTSEYIFADCTQSLPSEPLNNNAPKSSSSLTILCSLSFSL